jgi:hypothetical protein
VHVLGGSHGKCRTFQGQCFCRRGRVIYMLAPTLVVLASAQISTTTRSPVLPWNATQFAARLARWEALASSISVVESDQPSTCSNDMRSGVPSCTQFGSMWCWATAVASFTEFYTSKGPSQCRGLECEIVGWVNTAQCCPLDKHHECDEDGARPDDIVRAATHFTGRPHADFGGPMPQARLDNELRAAKPIMMLVGAGRSATHVVWLRGCGNGKYYYWDPEWSQAHGGVYPKGSDARSYSELLTFRYPSGYTQKWLDTIYQA